MQETVKRFAELEARESLSNGLGEIAEAYDEGWDVGSDEGSDD